MSERHRNANWVLPDHLDWNQVSIALLMDIRDELRVIRDRVAPLYVLNCSNFRDIPNRLNAIKRNTIRRKRTTKKA